MFLNRLNDMGMSLKGTACVGGHQIHGKRAAHLIKDICRGADQVGIARHARNLHMK